MGRTLSIVNNLFTTSTISTTSSTSLPSTLPIISPLLEFAPGLSIAAYTHKGLLHTISGAPNQDRNAIFSSPYSPLAMLSVFSSYGKHGSHLSQLAAATITTYVLHHYHRTPQLQCLAKNALLAANNHINQLPYAANSATIPTLCLIHSNMLVVAKPPLSSCSTKPLVLVIAKRFSKLTVKMIKNGIFKLSKNDQLVLVSTQPLWCGQDVGEAAPKQFIECLEKVWKLTTLQIVEKIGYWAYGKTKQIRDGTVLCAKLR